MENNDGEKFHQYYCEFLKAQQKINQNLNRINLFNKKVSVIFTGSEQSPEFKKLTEVVAFYKPAFELICEPKKSSHEDDFSFANSHELGDIFNCLAQSAKGDYLVFANDSVIFEDCFFPEILRAINKGNWDFIYSDSDCLIGDKTNEVLLKPDYSKYLLLSINYIRKVFVVKKEVFIKLGGFDTSLNELIFWGFCLNLFDAKANVLHIPKVLFHEKLDKQKEADNIIPKLEISQVKKLISSIKNSDSLKFKVNKTSDLGIFKVTPLVKKHQLVSIIVPFKNKPELLKNLVLSLKEHEDKISYELIAVNNGSEHETMKLLKEFLAEHNVRLLNYFKDFNWSKINNYAVSFAKGDVLLFLNNDIVCKSRNPIYELTSYLEDPEVGVVGARLIYPSGFLQHAGIVLNLEDVCEHAFKGLEQTDPGYLKMAKISREVSAVTGAAFATKRELFIQLGGFDERFPKSFNDVDFCLRTQKLDKKVLYCASCEFYHVEGATRDNLPENKEASLFLKKWYKVLKNGDPFYNPNFSLSLPGFKMQAHYNFDTLIQEQFSLKKE
jgi:GT2 family glycosyltransferase